MDCADCALSLERSLSQVEGVEAVIGDINGNGDMVYFRGNRRADGYGCCSFVGVEYLDGGNDGSGDFGTGDGEGVIGFSGEVGFDEILEGFIGLEVVGAGFGEDGDCGVITKNSNGNGDEAGGGVGVGDGEGDLV